MRADGTESIQHEFCTIKSSTEKDIASDNASGLQCTADNSERTIIGLEPLTRSLMDCSSRTNHVTMNPK